MKVRVVVCTACSSGPGTVNPRQQMRRSFPCYFTQIYKNYFSLMYILMSGNLHGSCHLAISAMECGVLPLMCRGDKSGQERAYPRFPPLPRRPQDRLPAPTLLTQQSGRGARTRRRLRRAPLCTPPLLLVDESRSHDAEHSPPCVLVSRVCAPKGEHRATGMTAVALWIRNERSRRSGECDEYWVTTQKPITRELRGVSCRLDCGVNPPKDGRFLSCFLARNAKRRPSVLSTQSSR